ncbi:MAG: molybdopterin molybdotransferase MoeA, partial [Flavobacteriales bacterium]
MDKLITPKEAKLLVGEQSLNLGSERVDLLLSRGRLLAEDVLTDRDYPPFNRATMDGICISFGDLADLKKTGLEIYSTIFAGDAKSEIPNGKAAKIMTGACLPEGADTVIRVEDLTFENNTVRLKMDCTIVRGQSLHLKGSDHQRNQVVIEKGTLIQPGTIAALATLGISEPLVRKNPRVAIVATGNELVPVGAVPKEHQIRTSNSPFLMSLCDQLGLEREAFYLTDNVESTNAMIAQLLSSFDILLFTGGVSKGEKDFVADALLSNGVKKCFHGVKQKPGKPMWFGKTEDSLVFAFPGNPV